MVESFFLINGKTVYARGSCRINEQGLKDLRRALIRDDRPALALLSGRYSIGRSDMKRVVQYIEENMLGGPEQP